MTQPRGGRRPKYSFRAAQLRQERAELMRYMRRARNQGEETYASALELAAQRAFVEQRALEADDDAPPAAS